MQIEPSLQSFIDSHLTIARATFAQNADDETLNASALLAFAGMGLAKTIPENGETVWVKTDKLKELEKSPRMPVDLTPFMQACPQKSGEPPMTGSLKLIVADIVANMNAEAKGDSAVDLVLLGLADKDLVSFVTPDDDSWVWVATTDLIDSYKMGKKGRHTVGKPQIRMDETLIGLINMLQTLGGIWMGDQIPKSVKRACTIGLLLAQELNGEVIAYNDDKGRLAWKASEEMQRRFE